MVKSHHEEGVTPVDMARLQEQAKEWAQTFAATSKLIVSVQDIYAWGWPRSRPLR